MSNPIKIGALAGVMDAQRIENGAFCHFKIPEGLPNEGEPMYLDAVKKEGPVGAMVRSGESAHFRMKGFNIQTKALSVTKRAKASEQDAKLEEQMVLERPRRFAALVVCLRNPDPALKGDHVPSEEQLIEMGGRGDLQWMVNQVMNFAFDPSEFGSSAGNALAGAAAPPAGDSLA